MSGASKRRRGTTDRPSTALPEGTHEWVSFPDPEEERTWLFDVTFLESNWTCIYGRGCEGVLTGPAPEMEQGCCSYGAHLTGKEDAKRVERAATSLTPEQWQYWKRGQRRDKRSGVITRRGEETMTTRIVDGACIFLNRPGWPGGAGCALHQAAVARGVPHLELKPDVCWQLPLRREDEVSSDGHVISIVRQWERRDWGGGGAEFHWWCTEAPDAFVGSRPVHEELSDELRAMVGRKVFKRLKTYLSARQPSEAAGPAKAFSPVPVRVPHPALRAR